MTPEEIEYLKSACPYLNEAYLRYLRSFRLKPSEQVEISFTPIQDTGSDDDLGDLEYFTKGLWVETILYEIPLLALTSEAYFKFCDKDWDYSLQEERAYRKGLALLENGCIFSEFGSRRRRDYYTHDLVMQGLCRAAAEGKQRGWNGVFTGTSNVHFAMRYGVNPVGTVAHEWYMAIAAFTNDYEHANELSLRYWLGCFGEGVRFPILFFENCRYRRKSWGKNKLTYDYLGSGDCADRHIRHACVPRSVPQAYSRLYNSWDGCRYHAAVKSINHYGISTREPCRDQTTCDGTGPPA